MRHLSMFRWFRFAFVLSAIALFAGGSIRATETLDVRSDGSDGPFAPATNTTVDLSLAAEAAWNTPAPVAGQGVYDAARWAVVFKYTTVNIPAGVTVKFKNHPKMAPVVWLVDGDVTIDGTVDLSGQEGGGIQASVLAEPGPGGFRGGQGWISTSTGAGSGFGPGGGDKNGAYNYSGAGHAFPGYLFSNGRSFTYGNPSLLPLVGGSGGGGSYSINTSGGGGGGAILIAAKAVMALNGNIIAKGGTGNYSGSNASSGSGGGIRIIAASLGGTGRIDAQGGPANNGLFGGNGRIRLEYRQLESVAPVAVPEPSVVTAELTPRLWLIGDSGELAAPQARIVKVGSVDVAADPNASFGARGHDVVLAKTDSTEVIVETRNAEQASLVRVRFGPRTGDARYVELTAPDLGYPGTDVDNKIFYWRATFGSTPAPLSPGAAIVQAQVIRP